MSLQEQEPFNSASAILPERLPAPPEIWPQPLTPQPQLRWTAGSPQYPRWPVPGPYPWSVFNDGSYRAKPQPLTFVLIHGAWADASFWDGIAAELRSQGHVVYSPEYPGHGSDPNKNVSHAQMTKAIADFIVSHNLRNIVLVGHSFGGTLIQKVAELVPERIKRLVFLNAFVLKDGQSAADELPPQAREAFQQLQKSSGNNTIMLPFPLFRDGFANLGSLETVQAMYDRITPEPAKPLFEKLNLKKFYKLDIPKSYVYLMEDNVLPFGSSQYGWHPHMSGRLGFFRFLQTHGDHMTTAKTEPRRIAQKIYEAGRD